MMIFGFLRQNLKTKAVAVAFSIAWLAAGVEPQLRDARGRERLAEFRQELYWCFTARADALFEMADAVLCADGPVRTPAGLSLAPEHRRGHGALYDAVNHGRIGVARLRRSLAGSPVAGVLAPVRPRAHLPPVQAGPRLDHPEDPRPAGRGPVDLGHHRGPRPAPPR